MNYGRQEKVAYKDNCGFRKLDCCGFKAEDCSPANCDMFEIEFNSSSIHIKMKQLEDEIRGLSEKVNNTSTFIRLLKLEKEDKTNPEVTDFKKQILRLKDRQDGYKYLHKAYTFCKRSGR